jgi:hypothetical protein
VRAARPLPPEPRKLYLVSTDQDDRDTLPPTAATEPPSAIDSDARLSAAVRFPGYDESNFMHRATAAVIDGTNALLAAKQTYDIEAILQRQRVLFEETIGPKLDTIAGRVTHAETGLADLRKEFEQLKTRMGELERRIGKEGASVAAESPAPR